MKDKLKVKFLDWGKIDYESAWEKQTILHNQLKDRKVTNRRKGLNYEQEHFLIFCEHNPVYTLGKSGSLDNLLLTQTQLTEKSIDFYKINRGGDITYHGPGQIVVYPIFDLEEMFTDVHKYVRYLEETIIRTLREYGIEGTRISGYTGVWLDENNSHPKRKICAIGVHLSRWVSMHGLAFNVNTDLNYFEHIIPCGIDDQDKTVCSMASELEKQVDYHEVKRKLANNFEQQFNIELYD